QNYPHVVLPGSASTGNCHVHGDWKCAVGRKRRHTDTRYEEVTGRHTVAGPCQPNVCCGGIRCCATVVANRKAYVDLRTSHDAGWCDRKILRDQIRLCRGDRDRLDVFVV